VLDAGPDITVEGPNGSVNASANGNAYRATLSSSGTYLSPGTITVSAPGGKDVPSFSTSLALPALPTMTSPQPDSANAIPVTRSSGMTVSWTPGAANEYVAIAAYSATDNAYSLGASLLCIAPAAAGSFVVPPSALLALPAGSFAGLDFQALVAPANLTGTGLEVTEWTLEYNYFTPLAFN